MDLSGAQVPDVSDARPRRGWSRCSARAAHPSRAARAPRRSCGSARCSRTRAISRAHRALFDSAGRGASTFAGRLDLEALQPVLERRACRSSIQANRASDLLAAMRLAREFNLRLVLMGAAEGWMVADELAREHVPVVINALTDIPSVRLARRDARERGAPVEGRRDRGAGDVRHLQLAGPPADRGERDRQRDGPRCGAEGRHA